MSPTDNGGRVTPREFYDALMDQNKARAKMELRLGDKIDDITSAIAASNVRFEAMDKSCISISKRIDTNVADITKVRNLNAILTALFSSIAAFVGLSR